MARSSGSLRPQGFAAGAGFPLRHSVIGRALPHAVGARVPLAAALLLALVPVALLRLSSSGLPFAGTRATLSHAAGASGSKLSLAATKDKVKEEKKQDPDEKAQPRGAESVKIATRAEDYAQWYLDVIAAADLISDAPVRGCKVLRPNGFAIWENIQRFMDPKLRKMGVQNAYFPLLIPVSFLAKEAAHVEGFAKECAVVTHHRLKSVPAEMGPDGKMKPASVDVDPDSKLAEPFVVRPTSETIVWHMYGQWIKSYTDLPLKMNQWVNVMRWEMRTRPFLRSSEFLWQEGHTAHATKEDADQQARDALKLYIELAQDQLALPLFPGRKSDRERFAGADETYTIEALAQNGMAIQAGTSHFLGQNFAKAFDVTFETQEQTKEFVWATSWGVSTRLIGAIIMAHSDDTGIILPPVVAATQVVILPMFSKDPVIQANVLKAAEDLRDTLENNGIRVDIDYRVDVRPGAKFFTYERKGVPLRLELGPRDLEEGIAMGKRRTGGDKVKIQLSNAVEEVRAQLDGVLKDLHARSDALRERLTTRIHSREEFDARLKEREIGMMKVPWGGNDEDEEKLQEDTGITLRCYPLQQEPVPEGEVCPLTGKPSRIWALFAKAY
eukprot:CAMPEP_0203970540 /NCGR_PEP_ID=MMETSP0359-20131031/98017_1 /ASSEMBLY_ACC=CAM_ASM_000338 /TAXON_ID=268821 /ORGANISM="Scrippsiella Hangoei, Strain SHTV-5" /LENGTH=611 /DNA_ID=CAMNT_0050908497 /DNA_START=30 /DNA_END=1865 /DNA_ORIENTATION=-